MYHHHYHHADERRPLLSKTSSTLVRYSKENLQRIDCFNLIHKIRKDIELLCDTPLNTKELESPKLIFLISPLQDKYISLDCVAIVYCLLVCRIHFLGLQQNTPSVYSLAYSRAALCEIIAVKIMRKTFDEDPDSNETLLKLAYNLNASFSPFQGAPEEVIKYHESVEEEDTRLGLPKGNALELAIIGNAKRLIQARPVQVVLDAIWDGDIIYSPTSFIDLLPDHYNRKPIMLYDSSRSPILNQHRLIVPRIRALLEAAQFIVLFASYCAVLFSMRPEKMNGWEIWLAVYASGWALDKFASVLEHGLAVYCRNLWNGIDLTFIGVFALYLILRLLDVSAATGTYFAESLNVLACGSIILFPRFAFWVVSRSPLVLGLRAMFIKFVYMILLAAWCFLGFLLAFYIIGAGKFPPSEIAKFMVWVTFGMDGTPISQARHFHPYLGPFLWVAYACVSSTLLLTTTISILSNTFRHIADDAGAEQLYRFAVDVHEGVKSDAIFLYQPPFNILAFIILFPLRFFVSTRIFHQINVYASRILNAPILIAVALYERRFTFVEKARHTRLFVLFKRIMSYTTVHGDLVTVFQLPPELAETILPRNGLLMSRDSRSARDSSSDERRGRSPSPVSRRPKGSRGTSQQQRAGSRPSPLTRLYGRGGNSEDIDAIARRMDRLEESLARIEEVAVKLASADG